MTTWKISINGAAAVTLESLGITLAGGDFVSHGAGSVRLALDGPFEAAGPLAYGNSVKIIRDESGTPTTVFAGKCRTVPRFGNDSAEGMQVVCVDVWRDLEETIYQENWAAFMLSEGTYVSGDAKLSRSIIGVTPTGTPRTTAQVISAVVAYAVGVGLPIAMGSIPTGMKMVPREIDGRTCAEIILEVLNQHPNWLTWVDYSAATPVLHFADRATATARSYPVDGSGTVADFSITRRDDLIPARVILNFESAGGIELEIGTARGITRDIYPATGPTEGPGVLVATMQLPTVEGVAATFTPAIIDTQKARIQVRTIPADGATDTAKKAWLKLKYRHLKNVADANFTVPTWTRTLEDFGEDPPAPISGDPIADPADADDVPNELVAGTIEDWMAEKTGRVRVAATVKAASGATEAERKEINKPLPPCIVVATSATSGLKQRVVSYTPAVGTPETPASQAAGLSGLAQQYYEALNQNTFEGSVTLTAAEIPTERIAGCVINLTTGHSEWETMAALVNSVSWDVVSGTATVSFGPPRWQSFADFVSMMEALRSPAGTRASETDRTGDSIPGGGAAGDAELDSIQGFTSPETIYEQPEIPETQGGPFTAYVTGDAKCKISAGYVVTNVATGAFSSVTGLGTERTLASGTKIWLKATFTTGLVLTGIAVETGTSWPSPMIHFTGTAPDEYQDFAYCALGEVSAGEMTDGLAGFEFSISGTTYHFWQHLRTNLVMAACAVDGKAAKAFLPFSG